MVDVSNRCPVTWRFILGIDSRIPKDGSHDLIYATELEELGLLKMRAASIGRSHSAQLQRGFFLLECLISKLVKLRALEPEVRTRKFERSREGLEGVLVALHDGEMTLEASIGEMLLGGQARRVSNPQWATTQETIVFSDTSGQRHQRSLAAIAATVNVATDLKHSLIESEDTMGALAIDAHKALDSLATTMQERVSLAIVLSQITEGSPITGWTTQH